MNSSGEKGLQRSPMEDIRGDFLGFILENLDEEDIQSLILVSKTIKKKIDYICLQRIRRNPTYHYFKKVTKGKEPIKEIILSSTRNNSDWLYSLIENICIDSLGIILKDLEEEDIKNLMLVSKTIKEKIDYIYLQEIKKNPIYHYFKIVKPEKMINVSSWDSSSSDYYGNDWDSSNDDYYNTWCSDSSDSSVW